MYKNRKVQRFFYKHVVFNLVTLIAMKARLAVARIVRLMTTKPCGGIDLAHFRFYRPGDDHVSL